MATHVEVELDIFSGMPNPTWVLTDAEAGRFARRLAQLPETSDGELPGNLGYRGLIVRATDGTRTQMIRIHAGSVHVSNGLSNRAFDPNRELERWLLDTGRPHLKPELLAAVERDFHTRPPPAHATPSEAPDVPRQAPTGSSQREF